MNILPVNSIMFGRRNLKKLHDNSENTQLYNKEEGIDFILDVYSSILDEINTYKNKIVEAEKEIPKNNKKINAFKQKLKEAEESKKQLEDILNYIKTAPKGQRIKIHIEQLP